LRGDLPIVVRQVANDTGGEETSPMFDNVKIATKFHIALGLIALMVVVVAVSGYLGLGHVVSTSENVLLRDARIAERALAARSSALQLRRYEKDYFLNIGAPQIQAEYLDKWKTAHEQLAHELDDLDDMVSSQRDHDILKAMRADMATYVAGFTEVSAAVRQGTLATPQEANHEITKYKPAIRRMETTAGALGGESDYRMRERMRLLPADVKDTNVQMTVTALLAIAVALLMGMRLSRSVIAPVREMVSMARRIAQGQPGGPVKVTARDEMGELQQALNAINERVRRGDSVAAS
jgi:methyl-accepting chemotaxis protein